MSQPKKSNYRELEKLINNYGFLKEKLEANSLIAFKEITEVIFARMALPKSQKDHKLQSVELLNTLLTILRDNHKQITLNYVIKKLTILHAFLHQTCLLKHCGKDMESLLRREINQILKEQTQKLLNPIQKRQNSLTKAFHYIRELSGSKDKKQNKLKLQQQNSKGAITQIVKKVIEPFCLYLLKVSQDHKIYTSIINKRQKSDGSELEWKMLNWSLALGQIIMQLNRMGRYFRDELMGVWVFIVYCISIDISLYYDEFKIYIRRQINHWLGLIVEAKEINKQKGVLFSVQCENIMNDSKMSQFLNLIKEGKGLKQKMNYIYCNVALKNQRKLFAKSYYFKNEQEEDHNMEDILKFIEQCSKYIKKYNNYTGIFTKDINDFNAFESEIIKTKQTAEGDSPQLIEKLQQQLKKSQTIFDSCQSSQLFHIENTVNIQSRRANFLNIKRSRETDNRNVFFKI